MADPEGVRLAKEGQVRKEIVQVPVRKKELPPSDSSADDVMEGGGHPGGPIWAWQGDVRSQLVCKAISAPTLYIAPLIDLSGNNESSQERNLLLRKERGHPPSPTLEQEVSHASI